MPVKPFFYFLVAILLFSCNKEVIDDTPPSDLSNYQPPSNPEPTDPNVKFLKATIDGNVWTASEGMNGCEIIRQTTHLENLSDNTIEVAFASYFDQNSSNSIITTNLKGKLKVQFPDHHYSMSNYYNSNVPFFSSFPMENYSYFQNSSTTSGAEIIYEDENGEIWTSKLGNQTGSTFKVTSCIDGLDGLTPIELVKGDFTCKVYSSSQPSLKKVVTDGGFYLVFEK